MRLRVVERERAHERLDEDVLGRVGDVLPRPKAPAVSEQDAVDAVVPVLDGLAVDSQETPFPHVEIDHPGVHVVVAERRDVGFLAPEQSLDHHLLHQVEVEVVLAVDRVAVVQ